MHFNRYSASATHLALSLLVFSSLVFTMLFFWFPGKLFFLDGGIQGLKLVAMVDLVLGPLLTLILFKPGKKMLLLDMSTIAMVQLVALGYGFFTTYQQQTVAVVYAENMFNTVSLAAHQDANRELIKREKNPANVKDFGSERPRNIYTVKPVGASIAKYVGDLLNGLPEAHERSDKYLVVKDHYDEMKETRVTREKLEEDGNWVLVEAALVKKQRSLDTVDLYNFKARYASGIAVFDPSKMRIVDYVKLKGVKPENPGETAEDTQQASSESD